jgi:hypothetical protein
MSRSMISMALSTLALMALPGTGSATGGAGGIPSISATVEQCVTAATQADRSVAFTGQMETVAGARRMAMQVVVQEHVPGEAGFHTITAAGLGAWQRSEVGVKIYKYVRQVTDLPAPAAFRAIIQFRWLDDQGHVIRRAMRRTQACRQPAGPPPAPQPQPASPAVG